MIIGLLGRARVGKDTVARLLQDHLQGEDYIILRIAQPIKSAVCALYNINPSVLESAEKEAYIPGYNITPRQAMQAITDTYLKKHSDFFFSQQVFAKIDASTNKHCVIPDIRYNHDVIEVQKRGGVVIKVTRPENKVYHECESTVDKCSYNLEIVNDGNMNELDTKVLFISQMLRKLNH